MSAVVLGLTESHADAVRREEQERAEYEKATVVTTEGWTIADLRKAFDVVSPAENWKAPIDKSLIVKSAEERRKIAKAVQFFTGSEADWTHDGAGRWTLKAAGYWAAVGA